MFTGIIEETGKIRSITSNRISIDCKKVTEGTKQGDSISVNGVCLTVCEISEKNFTADVSPQTLEVTALGELSAGSVVNLERAMPSTGRFGGHIVSGHIDGKGICKGFGQNNDFFLLEIQVEPKISKYFVQKGSVAVNGISLTIYEVCDDVIKIAVIPHTAENTNLKFIRKGDFVNIEVDIFAKYIEKFLSTSDNKSEINLDFLQRNGF